MKSVVKPLSIISVILYIAGIFAAAFYFYKLPGKLIEHSSVLHLDNIREIQPALNLILLVTGLTMTSGLLAIVLHIIQSNGHSEATTVEKFKADTADKAQEQAQSTEQEYDVSSLSQDILQKIKNASESQEGPDKILETALRAVCNQLEACQGAVYVARKDQQKRFIEMRASYAYMKPDSQTIRYEFGEGLAGQIAKEGKSTILNSVPDGYIKIISGLGKATPKHLILAPVIAEEKVLGLVEIASFTAFSRQHQEITQQAFAMLAEHFKASSLEEIAEEQSLEELENNGINQ
jgi:hypothetical protein